MVPSLTRARVALIYTPVITTCNAIVTVTTDAVNPSKTNPLTKKSIRNARTKLHNLADAIVTGDFVMMGIVSRVNVNIRITKARRKAMPRQLLSQ